MDSPGEGPVTREMSPFDDVMLNTSKEMLGYFEEVKEHALDGIAKLILASNRFCVIEYSYLPGDAYMCHMIPYSF